MLVIPLHSHEGMIPIAFNLRTCGTLLLSAPPVLPFSQSSARTSSLHASRSSRPARASGPTTWPLSPRVRPPLPHMH